MMGQKQLKVRAGKVNGHLALNLARKRTVPEGLEAEYAAAREWYEAKLEKGRKQRHSAKRASRPAAWTAKLDKLCGDIVRARGVCEANGYVISGNEGVYKFVACDPSRPLQWAHLESRRHFRSRWDHEQHFCLCPAHHLWFTHHPIEWVEFVRLAYPQRYARLRKLRTFEVPRGAARIDWYRAIEAGLKVRRDG